MNAAPEPLDQLARLLLAEHSLQSVMTAVAEVGRDLVSDAVDVSVTLVSGKGAVTVASTGELALRLDERQYAEDAGPCLEAALRGRVVSVPDTGATGEQWPSYASAAQACGVRSSLSVPVPARAPLHAAINVYSLRPGAFDEVAVTEVQRLADRAGTALANMRLVEAQQQLAEQLRDAMASRAVIEQAKGILMAERRVGGDEAFALLVTLSQHSNRKLREVARALVDKAESLRD